MTNAASSRQIARRAKQSAEDARDESMVLGTIMKFHHGRRWMWLMLSRAGIFTASESLEPQVLAWREGQRNEGLRLLSAILKHTPNEYVLMTNENSSANLQEADDGRTDTDD